MVAPRVLCILLLCTGCEEPAPVGGEAPSGPSSTDAPLPTAAFSALPADSERDHRPVEPPPGLRPASCADLALPKGATRKTVERDPGKFRLLTPGTAPHRALRYQWVWGQETPIAIRKAHSSDGSKPVFEGPPAARGKATVHCITKTGEARVHFRVATGAEHYAKEIVGYQIVSPRGSSIEAGMIGLGTTLVDRGPTSHGEYDAFSPVRLPEEAVGVGAKWETIHEMPNGVREKSIYEISSIQGNAVEIAATVAQEEISDQPGIKVLMSGTSVLHIDLSRPIAPSEIFLTHEKMGTVGAQVIFENGGE